jgi:spermidine synthase
VSRHALVYLLVFASGTAGLIYQVVWHRYLALLLGAEARATATILAVFLGGLALGYVLFGRWSRGRRNSLLVAYVVVEAGIAAWALLFPYVFGAAFANAGTLYRWFGANGIALDLLCAVVLLLPPTILMGGTLPLLTQAFGDNLLDASKTHAKIYGFNTLGACFGSLVAGYYLVPQYSLEVTLLVAGTLNALIATVFWLGFARGPVARGEVERRGQPVAVANVPWREPSQLALLGVAACSGFYVITLEAVLIRLTGLSAGSSHYNFTLIVTCFVFSLGVGSLLLRRAERFRPLSLVWVQVAATTALTFLYCTADRWPYWVHRVRILFRDDPEAFPVYQAALGGLFLVVLVVPLACCGLVLPLCFHLLRDEKRTLGLRVGQLYGVNTVACVLGAVLGGYGLLHWLNLDDVFRLAVLVALGGVGFGVWFVATRETLAKSSIAAVSAFAVAVPVTLWNAGEFERGRFVQPFRQQAPRRESYVGIQAWTERIRPEKGYLFYKDGPNTTVAVSASYGDDGRERSRTIFVNGKSDGNTKGDFFTMMMTGLLPGIFAPRLDRGCIIGFGTGITVGALLGFPETERIDVVDIAKTVFDAAPLFDMYNGGVSTDRRVRFHATDAFRFLRGSDERFDYIVSEPSNPWVTGVENLYSVEYYETVLERLAPDGVFLQWVQTYSFDNELLQMVLKTLTARFPYVTVFQMLEHDLALVATRDQSRAEWIERARRRLESAPRARAWLRDAGIRDLPTLLALELVPPSVTAILGAEAKENRLLTPRLSAAAARAFFASTTASVPALRRQFKEYFPATGDALLASVLGQKPPNKEMLERFLRAFCGAEASRNRELCFESLVVAKMLEPNERWELMFDGMLPAPEAAVAARFAEDPSRLRSFDGRDLQQTQDMFSLFKRVRSPIAVLPVRAITDRLERCLAVVPKATELHGDCLLELVAVLEVADPDPERFGKAIGRFETWFTSAPPTLEGYDRFRKALTIMQRLKEEMLSRGLASPR